MSLGPNDLRVVAAMPQFVKARHPALVAAHRLAVDQAAAHLQFVHSPDNERVAGGPVMPVPGQQPDANRQSITAGHQPIAVMFDFMHPNLAGLAIAHQGMAGRAR